MPLLSVVLATHNRARYAVKSVESLLTLRASDVECVVHDTSETPELEGYCRQLNDDRLTYVRGGTHLSMTDNYNAAMGLARGAYVCLIGDDDGVLPDAILAARWAAENAIAAVSPTVVASYVWPDFRSKMFGSAHAGRLYLRRSFGGYRWISGSTALARSLQSACQGTDHLPRVYHGIVKRSLLEEVKRRSGAFFHGLSPDVSAAVGIAAVIDRFIEVDFPLTLPGVSAGSNSGRRALDADKGSLEEDPHTRRFKHLQWTELIPRFACVETVWGHAGWSTIHAVASGAASKFNFPRLYAEILLKHPERRHDVRRALEAFAVSRNISVSRAKRIVAAEYGTVLFSSLARLIRRAAIPTAAGGRYHINNLANVAVAVDAYEQYAQTRGIRFSSFAASVDGTALHHR